MNISHHLLFQPSEKSGLKRQFNTNVEEYHLITTKSIKYI